MTGNPREWELELQLIVFFISIFQNFHNVNIVKEIHLQ